MSIPEIIRANRQAQRLTQRQLGEACGYEAKSAERVVQLWEHGKQPVPLDKIRVLAAALQIPIESLIP